MASVLTGSKTTSLVRYTQEGTLRVTDSVAEEEPLEIKLLYKGHTYPVAITMRTPGRDVDLALGFLLTEGLLKQGINLVPTKSGRKQKNSVELHWPGDHPLPLGRLSRNGYTSSSCGVCGKTSLELVYQSLPYPETPGYWTVSSGLIPILPSRLRDAQQLFAVTGGIHAAGLFDPSGQFLHFAEDVGRHNALDKLIGYYHQSELLPLDRHILLLSGRASFELIQKAAMVSIRFVVAVGAPSSLAVELAEDQGITLCGFVRAGGFNCYTGEHRISH